MTLWINVIIQGVLVGGLYAMFAAGLSLIFGIMRLVNIAHGDLIVLAAYLALVATHTLGINPITSLLIVVPLMAALGYVLQRVLLNRTLGDDLLPPLLVTFGLSVIIQNALLEVFTADSVRLQAGAIETASIPVVPGISIGVLPLLQFVVAVVVIGGLQALFYRTALGRAFRATSDDPAVAQLMGLDNRHIFALGMALSLAVVAIAGVLLAIRTNFDPAIGPARLIFGFEAVIIGGLGSLWGTLAGGIVLGVAQGIGAQIDPGWQVLAGHLAFLVVLAVRPEGPVSQGARMSAPRVYFMDRSSRIAGAAFAALIVALVLAPYWADRQDLRLLAEIYAYVALASAWNLLAGYAGLVSIGQQAYVGLGGYLLFALTMLAGLPPLWSIPLAGHHRRRGVDPGRGAGVPPARALFRDRHLGGGGGVSPAGIAGFRARRRLRHQPARQHRAFDRGEPAGARVPHLLGRARPRAAGSGADRRAAALALRPRAHRDPRQRGRRPLERHRRHPGQARGLCDDRVLHGDGRRGDLPAEAAHLARRRVQHQRLDGVRHLHRRDRRRRPHRRARSSAPRSSSCCASCSPTSAASISCCSARWRSP